MIEFEGISKRFGGVQALQDVTLRVAAGECHGLVGENGAGKSTLGKILAGIHRPDRGAVRLEGRPRHFRSPREASLAGVGMVHQELAFCPDLSVAENLSLGRYPRRLRVFADRREMRARARRQLAEIGAALDVEQPMRRLTTGQEQMVQIAAAVGSGAKILVLDEPTSSLSEEESRRLFELMGRLRARGVTMIYVSHRLPEVLQLCDRVTVLRDGRLAGTVPRREATCDGLVRMMIGRDLEQYFSRSAGGTPGAVRLRVQGLSSPGKFEDVSLEVRAGEIVGLAGLVGAGRSEVAQAVFGLDRQARGVVEVDGRRLPRRSASAALERGVGYVPEDRKRQGLIAMMSGRGNFSLAILRRLQRWGLVNRAREAGEARDYFRRLRVRAPSIETPVAALSGGNQQKVVLARWLAAGCGVLLVDEPTRGVDVGAKQEIHGLIDELAGSGAAVLLISSDLPEVLNLSTRIVVFREGRVAGTLNRGEATADALLRLMAGVGKAAKPQDAEYR